MLAGAAAAITVAAGAQSEAAIRLTPPLVEAFPEITFFASVIAPDGRRLHALPATSFSLTEDQQPVTDFAIEERSIGSRQLYVVNVVTPLRRRDASGVTRLEQLRRTLVEAWRQRPASGVPDQVSLLVPGEIIAINRSGAADLIAPFEGWEEDYGGAEVGYQALLTALRLALDPLPAPGMETDIVFATPLLDRQNQEVLDEALTLAAVSGARIHAVLIGTPEQAEVAEALRLRQAAETSGGTFRVFDPQSGLGDLEERLRSARTRYVASYTSSVNASGTHAVQLSLTTPDLTAASEPVGFTIQVAPPQVAFIQPPARVVRQTSDPNTPLADIPPTFLELPLLVTYPDGHPRPASRLRLFINGALHETRTQAPLDLARWDLSTVVESGSFQLRAELTDSLGLTATTEILPIAVDVIPGPRGLPALQPALAPLLGGVGIVGAAALLVGAWVRLGQTSGETGWGMPRGLRRASLASLSSATTAEAYLTPLRPDGSSGEPVTLDGAEVTVGSDPSMCGLLLTDPSASPLHARITRRAAGVFHLRDQHSTAGTWVNLEPVDEDGRDLSHGDRIHFGRLEFRFRLAAPAAASRIEIRAATEGEQA